MKRMIHYMGFHPADLHVFPDYIPVHPGTRNIADKQHSYQPFTVRAENNLSIG
jgi:hypothetical protein